MVNMENQMSKYVRIAMRDVLHVQATYQPIVNLAMIIILLQLKMNVWV